MVGQPASFIKMLTVPVPLPVRATNCYIIESEAGSIIVDTGMNTPDGRSTWLTFLAEHGAQLPPVRLIFVTHFHPDHIGLARWLSQQVNAPVAMMAGEAERVRRYPRSLSSRFRQDIHAYYRRHHVPVQLIDQWLALDQMWAEALEVPERFDTIFPEQRFQFGRLELLFIEQAGHTPHQGLIYLPKANYLLTGDQILSRITPNISLWPEGPANPLDDYLHALDRLAKLPHPVGLGAHEDVMPNVNLRIAEIQHHHAQRNQKLLELMDNPLPAHELTQRLFTRPLDDYQWRFALGETLAHLTYLMYQGRVLQRSDGDVTVFERG